MNRDLEAEHIRPTHLTTILGNAQLLRCRITRSRTLTPSERDNPLRAITVIDRAAISLQRDLEPEPSSPEHDRSI